ncbi:protein of unknown function [Methanoculleus bourgensis]|uniref:Uncharacterized protein n=1 Tax=Methanoculleus bourgensis TaxID=83986 RepID=A0A0X3BN78_9EURY|nr:protein of unknown function [Methanoculleus bourgensis]
MNFGVPYPSLLYGCFQGTIGRFGTVYCNKYLTEHTHHAEQILPI